MIESVLLTTARFPPYGGDVERYVLSLGRELVRRAGLRVVVVTTGPSTARRYSTVAGLTVYRLPTDSAVAGVPIGLGWARHLRDIIRVEAVDVVNAHAPAPGLPDLTARVCGQLPFVLSYHSASARTGKWLGDVVSGAYERFVLPRTARRADRVICSSQHVAAHFADEFTGKDVTIPPGADLEVFTPAPLPDGDPRILFPASRPEEGLSDLMTAVAELRERGRPVRLDVVGPAGKYGDEAQALDIADAVRFHERLAADDDLVRLYHEATVVALPTYRDSFPSSLLAAMACGRPVVSTSVGAVPTLVEHGVNGLLGQPGDLRGLVERLDSVISNRPLAERLARAGRATAVTDLSWERQTMRTVEVYLEAQEFRSLAVQVG